MGCRVFLVRPAQFVAVTTIIAHHRFTLVVKVGHSPGESIKGFGRYLLKRFQRDRQCVVFIRNRLRSVVDGAVQGGRFNFRWWLRVLQRG